MWYIHTMDYYSALKGGGSDTRYNTKVIKLNEISQSQKGVAAECVVQRQGVEWWLPLVGEKQSVAISKCQLCKMLRVLGQTGTMALQ